MSQPNDQQPPEPVPHGTRTAVSRQAQILLAVVVLAAAAMVFWPRSKASVDAPEGMLVDAGGRPVPMASRMTPVTLVHFWATWCPPCMTEVPSIGRLADDFASYRGEFTVLMVSVADDAKRVKAFAGVRAGSVLYDPSWKMAHRYGTWKLPESFLVVHGKVVKRWIGDQDWDAAKNRRVIEKAIAGLGKD